MSVDGVDVINIKKNVSRIILTFYQANIASKLKRLTFKTRNARVFDLSTPYHFVRMRGPHLKGFAEVAVRKQDLSLEPSVPTFTKTSASDHFFGASETSTSAGVSSSAPDASPTCGSSVLEQDDDNAADTNPSEGDPFVIQSFQFHHCHKYYYSLATSYMYVDPPVHNRFCLLTAS